MINDLVDLEIALAFIEESMSDAIKILDDIDIDCDGEWQDIKQLRRIISGLRNAFIVEIPKSIQSAIDDAKEENERLADLWDAQSY